LVGISPSPKKEKEKEKEKETVKSGQARKKRLQRIEKGRKDPALPLALPALH
jgi:hypothetical protein